MQTVQTKVCNEKCLNNDDLRRHYRSKYSSSKYREGNQIDHVTLKLCDAFLWFCKHSESVLFSRDFKEYCDLEYLLILLALWLKMQDNKQKTYWKTFLKHFFQYKKIWSLRFLYIQYRPWHPNRDNLVGILLTTSRLCKHTKSIYL